MVEGIYPLGKLRYVKVTLKGWNKHVFGNLDCQIDFLRVVVGNMD